MPVRNNRTNRKGGIIVDLQVRTTTGEDALLRETVVEELKASLRGEMLRPGDDGYDAAREIWNVMIDKRPGLIVRCAGVADIISAVNFARTNNLLVAVRGGGHNVAGNAVCDGGIMIDLSPMKSVRVDPVGRTARAEPGLTGGDFDRETQAFGLVTTQGIVSTMGIAGLTLGGGHGWLMRKYGLTCDNLLSVDIVTADGRFLTASATENAELFWGVRGGGGSFGIVTSFENRLYPVGTLLAGAVIHPMEKAEDALKFYRDYTIEAPDEVFTVAALMNSPDGFPALVFVVGYVGPIEEGEHVLRPIREFGSPLADRVRPMAYIELQTMLDASNAPGFRNYFKSNFLKGLSDDAIDTMVSHCRTLPSSMSRMVIEHLGGAAGRVGKDETAFDHRDAHYNLVVIGTWSDPAESDRNIGWARELWEAMQPFSTDGVYVNYLGQEGDEGADRVRDAYGSEKYERLVALKNEYDPTNLFRLNQNIKPTV